MKIKNFIPNTITSMNLVCGIIGVVFAFKGRLDLAFPLMLLAAVFDFFDGFAARALGAYSDMGKELDSLCDLVSFGVLPSIMLYSLMKASSFGETWVCWIPLVISVFSALRLAKFNVDDRQHDSFIGLPTPACAIFCGALCYFVASTPLSFLSTWASGPVFVPVLSVVLSFLLVCEIPMFSLKFHKDDSATVKGKRMAMAFIVLAAVLVAVFCKLNWSFVPMITFLLYILKNIVYCIVGI